MDGWRACFCATSSVEVGMYMWSVRDLDHESMKSFYHGSQDLTKLKAIDKLQNHKVFDDAQTLALVGINLRSQAITHFL